MDLFYIEDEDFLITLFEVLFKKYSYLIYTTKDLDTIHLIEDQKPRIVLISLSFDYEKILSLVQSIKQISLKDTVLVAIGDLEQVDRIKERFIFDAYLIKPIAPLEVLEQLETYLKRL